MRASVHKRRGETVVRESDCTGFYSRLPTLALSVPELFRARENFHDVPTAWHVVVTDIESSTAAVDGGRHEDVNLVAAGSIIAALNVACRHGEEIPFFFGGDGATLLLPPSLHDEVLAALHGHRRNAAHHFGLRLRVGSVAVAAMRAAGDAIAIAKLRRASAFCIPVVAGGGISAAERLVKSRGSPRDTGDPPAVAADLSGMECRWDRIKPPARQDEVVCLLVNVPGDDTAHAVIAAVLEAIETIYGPRQRRNPISSRRLRLDLNPARIAREMRMKFGAMNWAYLAEQWGRTALIGPAFFRFAAAGRKYVETMPELSDTLVIDGRINTIMSGTGEDRRRLLAKLEALEAAGAIVFGVHVSDASIMSCYVRNRDDAHIHFVDGAGGGYTQAAKMLKRKHPAPRVSVTL